MSGQNCVPLFLLLFFLLIVDSQCQMTPLTCTGSTPETGNSSTAQEGLPSCTIWTSQGQSSPIFECSQPKENVYRIIGEYNELRLNCTAPFQLDLDYDGFRPTEALELSWWKQVEILDLNETAGIKNDFNIDVQLYGLTIQVTSIQFLFMKHLSHLKNVQKRINGRNPYLNQNLTTPLIYPRTGRFVIRGMHEPNLEKRQEFYFFFEEPLLKNEISFMENEHTLSTTREGTNLKIPCRPSHLTPNVTLTVTHMTDQKENWTILIQSNERNYDPTIGFQIPALFFNVKNENEYKFQCGVTGQNNIWQGDLKEVSKVTTVYGVHTLTEKPNEANLRVSNVVTAHQNDDEFECSSILRCFLDRRPEQNDSFFAYGTSTKMSMLELRYSREFVLPAFSHLSYNVQKWQTAPAIVDIFLEWANPQGAYFCVKDGTYIFQEYASGVELTDFQYPAGQKWTKLPQRTVASTVQISLRVLGGHKILYTKVPYTFICQVAGFSVVKPILWFVELKNQSRHLVFKDYKFKGVRSIWKSTLEKDVVKVTCLNSLWYRDEWNMASTIVTLLDGTPSVITSSQFTYNFALNSKNQINCQAQGNPLPNVTFTNSRGEILPVETSVTDLPGGGGSQKITLNFESVTRELLGVYKCTASNPYNDLTVDINVEELSSKIPTSLILGIGLPLLIIFIAVTLTLYILYRRQMKKSFLTQEELIAFRDGVIGQGGGGEGGVEIDTKYQPMAQPYRPDDFEIDPQDWTMDENGVLGSGAFGIVMKGTVKGMPVAVKTVRPGVDKKFLKSLLSELKILMYLGSFPNLINLVGASTVDLKKGVVHVFVELCQGGNLLSYLQDNRNEFGDGASNNYENTPNKRILDEPKFNLQVLHTWAHQIAQGMSFLKMRQVIHGDLAARNVLLTGDKQVKITDFGLSRQLYSYAMYMKKSEEPLPWRWMSLESLRNLQFSCESDVWSYGVTLWELYTLGQTPFPCMSWDKDFIEKLESGFRLGCPANLTSDFYAAVLVPCWHNGPTQRPTFESIVGTVHSFLDDKTPAFFTTPSEGLYANQVETKIGEPDSAHYVHDNENVYANSELKGPSKLESKENVGDGLYANEPVKNMQNESIYANTTSADTRYINL